MALKSQVLFKKGIGNTGSQAVYQGDTPFRRGGWSKTALAERTNITHDPRGPKVRGHAHTFNNNPMHVLNRGPEAYDPPNNSRRIPGGADIHGIPGTVYTLHGRPPEGRVKRHVTFEHGMDTTGGNTSQSVGRPSNVPTPSNVTIVPGQNITSSSYSPAVVQNPI